MPLARWPDEVSRARTSVISWTSILTNVFTTPILLITDNLMGTAYPLFTTPLYHNLTFRWGGTLIACVAAALAPIPIVLFWHGPKIRKRSRFASGLIHASTGKDNGDEDNRACGIPEGAAEDMSYKGEAEG